MANEYYISAGLVPIDGSSGGTSNNYYIAAGLVPTDTVEDTNITADPITITLSSLGTDVIGFVEGEAFGVTVSLTGTLLVQVYITSSPITIALSQLGGFVEGGIWEDVSIDLSMSLNENAVIGSNVSADPVSITVTLTASVLFQVYVTSSPITVTLSQLGSFVAGGVWEDVSIDIDFLLNTSAKMVTQLYVLSDPINLSLSVVFDKFLKNIGLDTSWIGDNKDQGPWTFSEQPDKWGYLNNPNWTGEEGVSDFIEKVGLSNAVDLSNEHRPCGHWHKEAVANYGPFTGGRFIAAKDQYGTPYIYVYDMGLYQTVRFDTSIFTCPIVDYVSVNSSGWTLDIASAYGPATYAHPQRGGYCVDKNGNRLWYLFREDGGTDAKLVEVDISGKKMSVIKTTTLSNLLADTDVRIKDGCSSNDFTFWCTNEKSGRIIKIRSSDHTLIDNHNFNYPASVTMPSDDEPIKSIDCHVGTQRLFWSYARSAQDEVPAYTERAYHIKADFDLTVKQTYTWAATGYPAPYWQNLVRVFGEDVYFNWIYYPGFGHIHRKSQGDISVSEAEYNDGSYYCLNLLNTYYGSFYILNYHPSIIGTSTFWLRKFEYGDLSEEGIEAKNPYCGYSGAPFQWSAVSAMSQQTGVIMIFRYETIAQGGVRNANWGASFDSDLTLLHDTLYTRILKNENYDKSDEPVVWPLEDDNWENEVEQWDGSTQYD